MAVCLPAEIFLNFPLIAMIFARAIPLPARMSQVNVPFTWRGCVEAYAYVKSNFPVGLALDVHVICSYDFRYVHVSSSMILCVPTESTRASNFTPTLTFIVLNALPSVTPNAKSYSMGLARQFTRLCECCFVLQTTKACCAYAGLTLGTKYAFSAVSWFALANHIPFQCRKVTKKCPGRQNWQRAITGHVSVAYSWRCYPL